MGGCLAAMQCAWLWIWGSTEHWRNWPTALRMELPSEVKQRSETLVRYIAGGSMLATDSRAIVVSARIWLCLYWFDHQ